MRLELVIGNRSFKTRGTLLIILSCAVLGAIIGSGLTPTTRTVTTIHTSVTVDDRTPGAVSATVNATSPTVLAQKQ